MRVHELKRYNVLWFGAVTVVLGAAYAASTSLFDGACTYADYVSNLIWANFSYIMPFTITLIGGFIIDREYTDDTLKALFCVPVSWRKLIAAKLVVAWLAAIAFGAFSFLCSVALSLAWVHPADSTAAALLRGAEQVIGLNALQFLALAPIIALFARWRGKFFVGVLVAFCYGFVGIFVAGQNLAACIRPRPRSESSATRPSTVRASSRITRLWARRCLRPVWW